MTLPGATAPGEEALRAEVRAWVEANWDPDLTVRGWWARLADSGWAYPTWPVGSFGRGLDQEAAAVVADELARAGVLGPPHNQAQTMGAPVLLDFGTPEQRERWLRRLATGEEAWCQFFSEPGAGSDLASVQTRAERDGDEWVVNGQKVWTGGAQYSDRGILVARTDPDKPKHRGLSFFVIDVDQPGIEIRPLRQMNHAAHFNEVFFTDARVPDANLVGGLDNGWAVAMATLAYERSAYAAGAVRLRTVTPGRKAGFLDLTVRDALARLDELDEHALEPFPLGDTAAMVALAREHGRDRDPVIRQRIAELHAIAETARLTALRARANARAGRAPGPESSLGYLLGVTIARRTRDLALEIVGAGGMLEGRDAPRDGAVAQMALSAQVHGIQGGTEQIQRTILGERVLGLPKEPVVDRDVPFRLLKVGTQRG